MLNLANTRTGPDIRWDWRDMIRALDLGGGGDAFYDYGCQKQRTRKHVVHAGGLTEDRIYLDSFELYRRRDPHDAIVEETESIHLLEANQRVLLVDDVLVSTHLRPDGLSVREQTLFRYQYTGQLGSVGTELDDSAKLVSHEEFHPYGTSAYRRMSSELEVPPRRYRYNSMERDEESGLGYNGARYYAVSILRWVSADPAALADGPNVYAYARCAPTRFSDSRGTVVDDDPWKSNDPYKMRPGSPDYTVDANPDKMFSENANARANMQQALDQTLENEFHLGSREKNIAAFEKKIDTLSDGPQQIAKRLNKASKKGYARYLANQTLTRFHRLEAKKPSWSYTPAQKEKLKAGRAPDPLQQLEHLNDLANDPKKSVTSIDDLYFTRGGRKGGIPKDSPHGKKNWGDEGNRMRAWEEKLKTQKSKAAQAPTTSSPTHGIKQGTSDASHQTKSFRNFDEFAEEVRAGRLALKPETKAARLIPESPAGSIAGVVTAMFYIAEGHEVSSPPSARHRLRPGRLAGYGLAGRPPRSRGVAEKGHVRFRPATADSRRLLIDE